MPLVRAPSLQRLHVVLDGDDRIRQSLEPMRCERPRVGAHDSTERAAHSFHYLDGALLAQHQQPGGDAPYELRHLVEPLRLGRRRERLRDRFLDARHVHDAFAQHGVLHETEFFVGRLVRRRRSGSGIRQDEAVIAIEVSSTGSAPQQC
jgi:hypothetical protein